MKTSSPTKENVIAFFTATFWTTAMVAPVASIDGATYPVLASRALKTPVHIPTIATAIMLYIDIETPSQRIVLFHSIWSSVSANRAINT